MLIILLCFTLSWKISERKWWHFSVKCGFTDEGGCNLFIMMLQSQQNYFWCLQQKEKKHPDNKLQSTGSSIWNRLELNRTDREEGEVAKGGARSCGLWAQQREPFLPCVIMSASIHTVCEATESLQLGVCSGKTTPVLPVCRPFIGKPGLSGTDPLSSLTFHTFMYQKCKFK